MNRPPVASPSRPRITEIRAEAGILIAISIWIGAGIFDRERNPNPHRSPDAHDRPVLTHLSNHIAKPLETRVPVESSVPQLLDFDGRNRKRRIEHPQIANGGELDRQRTWDRCNEIRPGDDERNTDEVRYLQANSPMQTLCRQTDLDDILNAPFLRDDDVLGCSAAIWMGRERQSG